MEQSKALKNKEVSAVELTKASIERIKSVDEKLGAFNSLTEETAKQKYTVVVEGGVTGVIMANLYKPLYNKDYDKLSSIVVTTKRFYRKIGLWEGQLFICL